MSNGPPTPGGTQEPPRRAEEALRRHSGGTSRHPADVNAPGTSQRLVANTVRTPAEQKGGAVEVPKRRSKGHVTQIGLELSRLYERYMSAA